jgi:hypothetical protein
MIRSLSHYNFTGDALTEKLESDPEFIALLTFVRSGIENMPAYVFLRMREEADRKRKRKIIHDAFTRPPPLPL